MKKARFPIDVRAGVYFFLHEVISRLFGLDVDMDREIEETKGENSRGKKPSVRKYIYG